MIGEATRNQPLRVALLTYRGNPHSGGQGVYVRELSRALVALGHTVTVFAGPPYPGVDPSVALVRVPSLDLYRPDSPFRPHRAIRDLIDVAEFGVMCAGRFPEPLTFSLRAWRTIARGAGEFDVIHDNQCLGYGLLGLDRRIPVVATIHHPIAVDLRLELAAATTHKRRAALRRWYGFARMQRRVARRLRRVVTVSAASRAGIAAEMRVDERRISVVPNGVDSDRFRPLAGVSRVPGRIVTTASADAPLKGLGQLLTAYAALRRRRHVELTVVGRPRRDGPLPRLLRELGLEGDVRFVHGVSVDDLVRLYAEASVAVVPSLYEGFSLPAIEAMACGVPLIATAAGGVPEVVGRDGDAAIVIPPGDIPALITAIERVLDDPELAGCLGHAGRARAVGCFNWRRTAALTADQYREVLAAC